MDWEYFIDKKVYLITRKNRIYTGRIKEVDNSPPLVWISLIDKYNKLIQLTAEEIVEIKEEEE